MRHNNLTYIQRASELPEESSWRRYRKGVSNLMAQGASELETQGFKYQTARTSFLAFADVMREGNLKVADFHEIVGSAFEDLVSKKYKRLMISLPPRSGKSMLSELFIAWLIGIDGSSQHIISSYSQQTSSARFRQVIEHLKNPEFNKVFPEWKGFKSDSVTEMVSGGNILRTAVGSTLCGCAYGTLTKNSPGIGVSLIDDLLKNSYLEKSPDNLEMWYREVLDTRQITNSAQVLIGTRFNVPDKGDFHNILKDIYGEYDPEENPRGWRIIDVMATAETEEQVGVRLNSHTYAINY